MKFAAWVFATLSLSSSLAFAQTSDDSSSRAVDSAYRARKAQLDAWVHSERDASHPQEDFISAFIGYGGYEQILPRDLNQMFSERTLRDSSSDRNQYSTVDRAFLFGVQAQLAKTWGIYVEYDLTMKWFNTQLPGSTTAISNAIEELDLTQDGFVVGGMYFIYSGRVYRLRAAGGIGGVVAFTTETETLSGSKSPTTRSASATGYQVDFDILNDFRVDKGVSFTLDFLFRTATTGALKTSGGKPLNSPFGSGSPTVITFQPTASSQAFGIAAGLVFYF